MLYCEKCNKNSVNIDGKNYGNCKICGSSLIIKKINKDKIKEEEVIVKNIIKVPSNNIKSEKITL